MTERSIKLAYKDIPRIRLEIIKNQNGKCLICGRENQDWCLDHDHESGYVRGVLCRSCNAVEGKTRKAFIRYGLRKAGINYLDFLKNLRTYIQSIETIYVHPKHKKKK